VIVPVVSLLTKAPDKALVENCFACYEETHVVKASAVLPEKK